jgi:hypothetical protein
MSMQKLRLIEFHKLYDFIPQLNMNAKSMLILAHGAWAKEVNGWALETDMNAPKYGLWRTSRTCNLFTLHNFPQQFTYRSHYYVSKKKICDTIISISN